MTAISARDAWAVGSHYTGTYPDETGKALIEHWDGTAWRHVPSPNGPGGASELTAVTATFPANA